MLKNNLKDILNIVLLRSDKILFELLKNNQNLNNKSDAYQNGVQDFYPNSFRKGTISHSMDYALDADSSKFTLNYDFDFLDALHKEYIQTDGSHIYAKKDILDKYSSLISKIHPYNLIGYDLAKKYNSGHISIRNIQEFAKYITPLALSTNRDYKDYADNHIHLGGANDVALNFLALLSQPTPKEFYTHEVLATLPRINEFSYINNGGISFGGLVDIAKYCVSAINRFAMSKKKDDEKNNNLMQEINLLFKYSKNSMVETDFMSFDMLYKFSQNGMKITDALLHEVVCFKAKGYASKQWFIYNILLFYLHLKSENSELKKVIKIFLHITNILRSYMVMSQNVGLSHFSEFFGSKLRKQEKKRHTNIASNIIANGTTKVEAKISPDAVLKNKEYIKYKLAFDKQIIKKECENLRTSKEKYFLDTNKSKRNYHFCIHFVRVEDKRKKTDLGYMPYRYLTLRNSLKKEAKELSSYLYNKSQVINKFDFYRKHHSNKKEVLKNRCELEKEYLDMSKLITSIDVAGDENRTPPEVFAPAIKYLRRSIKKQDEFMADYIKFQRDGHNFGEHYRLRISVHAGEDFNHIVTGMRKVHESVKFYDMGEKDRLGHALAIGLEPKKWCEQNGDIFVTKQEHLDNLVWLYHQAIEVLEYCGVARRLMLKYEKLVKELCKEVYSKNYALDDLYKAWKLREYCPIEMFGNGFTDADEYLKSVSFSHREDYDDAKEIYKKYHTNEAVRKNGEKVIKIEYTNIHDENLYRYRVTDDDLKLIEAVQDRLIQKFCDKGIIIETNPSSNVYIAHIDDYRYHPIYRWNPIEDKHLHHIEDEKPKFNKYGIRTSRMKVCVNTDDPAIMPTTLRNEFDLIERMAKDEHSDNQKRIEKWSDDIRKLGIEIFDFDHKSSEFTRV
ncbi:MAG: hypothetical protein U9N02_06090 [Campylobacterota bacterium]|nr:hypothetical protein [Campylobacterota bacterium]